MGSEGQGGSLSTSGSTGEQQHVQMTTGSGVQRRNIRKVSQAATPDLEEVVASDSSIKKVSDIVSKVID